MESLKLNGKEGHPRLHRIGFRGVWSPRKLVAVATIVGLVVSGLTLVPLPDGAADNGDDGFPDLRFTGGEIRIPREPVAGETISCTVDLENWGDQDAENVTIGLYDGNPYGSIHWTKHEGNPTIDLGGSGDWDDGRVLHASVLYEDGTYKMWYEGSKTGTYERQAIGYATSRDGLNWTKYESNPVLTDQNAEGGITVLRDSDGTYKMWYTSGGGRQIRHAYSDDGIGWTKYPGNPVLSNGNSGQWDSNLATLGSVIKDDDYYRMWYVGMDPGNIQKVGYATSPDGINWTKYMDNPVLNAGGGGAWDGDGVHFPRVLKVGSQYHMWYTGANGTWPWLYCIGHAVSQDGIEWTKNTGNPLLEKGTSGSWDDASVYSPSVLIQGTTSLMWFSGVDQQKASDGNHYERIGFASGNIGAPLSQTIVSLPSKGTTSISLDWTPGEPGIYDLHVVIGDVEPNDANWEDNVAVRTVEVLPRGVLSLMPDTPEYRLSEDGRNVTITATHTGGPANISFLVIDPDEETHLMETVRTTPDGDNHSATLTFRLPSDAPLGTWTVYATNDRDEARTNTTFAVVRAPPPSKQTLTLGPITDVRPGETVTVDFIVTNGFNVSKTFLLALQLKTPTHLALRPDIKEGQTINATDQRTWQLSVVIPTNAESGTYFLQGQMFTDWPDDRGGYVLDHTTTSVTVTAA